MFVSQQHLSLSKNSNGHFSTCLLQLSTETTDNYSECLLSWMSTVYWNYLLKLLSSTPVLNWSHFLNCAPSLYYYCTLFSLLHLSSLYSLYSTTLSTLLLFSLLSLLYYYTRLVIYWLTTCWLTPTTLTTTTLLLSTWFLGCSNYFELNTFLSFSLYYYSTLFSLLTTPLFPYLVAGGPKFEMDEGLSPSGLIFKTTNTSTCLTTTNLMKINFFVRYYCEPEA